MLDVQQLAVRYRDIRSLEDVSFHIHPGEVVGILGPNGAGKSTMMKAMLGLIPKSAGAVHYCTCPLHQQLEKVAYVPQRSQIDWDYPITVWHVVMMSRARSLGWFRRPNRQAKALVRAALERVDMLHLKDRRIGELSGGQQQRVFLARALAQEAEIFFFDEPFTGVDKKTESVMVKVFEELRSQGKMLLVSSHDWGNAMGVLDRLLLINQRIIADDTPQKVMTPENLLQAYGGVFYEQQGYAQHHGHHHPSETDWAC
ncbi:metal ABC transporter ATP-binding protein [filamentous cyanobacterium LEGE 11480]|uniref:Metal ABC transporter ATP-binding protein n=1 Tax=Romeriopsis navalis LEGE 11480 TaxID=2777977 RepID=A0A928VM71_9CYAN|nr:metal ABC transporter ATP-binding protein [Romeriopsis navalis]MBE9030192.1 metal ABC transporter ATP-binding protein [Romeriopsis navalis LEGE 11480]